MHKSFHPGKFFGVYHGRTPGTKKVAPRLCLDKSEFELTMLVAMSQILSCIINGILFPTQHSWPRCKPSRNTTIAEDEYGILNQLLIAYFLKRTQQNEKNQVHPSSYSDHAAEIGEDGDIRVPHSVPNAIRLVHLPS